MEIQTEIGHVSLFFTCLIPEVCKSAAAIRCLFWGSIFNLFKSMRTLDFLREGHPSTFKTNTYRDAMQIYHAQKTLTCWLCLQHLQPIHCVLIGSWGKLRKTMDPYGPMIVIKTPRFPCGFNRFQPNSQPKVQRRVRPWSCGYALRSWSRLGSKMQPREISRDMTEYDRINIEYV